MLRGQHGHQHERLVAARSSQTFAHHTFLDEAGAAMVTPRAAGVAEGGMVFLA